MPCPCENGGVALDTSAGVPAPRTQAPVTGGGKPGASGRRRLAGAAMVVIGVVVIARLLRRRTGGKNRFFTPYAQEDPIRPYQPYTGTEPLGQWGASAGVIPWAEAVDLRPPSVMDGLRATYW